MVSMKTIPEKEPMAGKGASMRMMPELDPPAYPYGLQVRIEDDQLTLLGIKELPPVGTRLRIVAIGEVISVSQNREMDGDVERCVCVQITDMDPPKPAARSAMYDASNMEP